MCERGVLLLSNTAYNATDLYLRLFGTVGDLFCVPEKLRRTEEWCLYLSTSGASNGGLCTSETTIADSSLKGGPSCKTGMPSRAY